MKTPFELNCPADIEIMGGDDWAPEINLIIEGGGVARMRATQRNSSDNGTLMTVWHGVDIEYSARWGFGALATFALEPLKAFLLEIGPLIDRVVAGHTSEHNGSNFVGKLTDDASEANDELHQIFDQIRLEDFASEYSPMDAADWLGDYAGDGIRADTSDEKVLQLARQDAIDALNEGYVLYGDTLTERQEAREEMRGNGVTL